MGRDSQDISDLSENQDICQETRNEKEQGERAEDKADSGNGIFAMTFELEPDMSIDEVIEKVTAYIHFSLEFEDVLFGKNPRCRTIVHGKFVVTGDTNDCIYTCHLYRSNDKKFSILLVWKSEGDNKVIHAELMDKSSFVELTKSGLLTYENFINMDEQENIQESSNHSSFNTVDANLDRTLSDSILPLDHSLQEQNYINLDGENPLLNEKVEYITVDDDTVSLEDNVEEIASQVPKQILQTELFEAKWLSDLYRHRFNLPKLNVSVGGREVELYPFHYQASTFNDLTNTPASRSYTYMDKSEEKVLYRWELKGAMSCLLGKVRREQYILFFKLHR